MRKLYFWAASAWTAGITASCLVSMKNFERAEIVEGADKYVHSTFYITFAILWSLYLRLARADWSKKKVGQIVLVAAILFGIIIEICQGLFTKDRSADIFDVLANTGGALIGLFLLWAFDKLKK